MDKIGWPPPKKRGHFWEVFFWSLIFLFFNLWSKYCLRMLRSLVWIGRNDHTTILHSLLILSSKKNFEIVKIDKKGSFCLLNNSLIFYEENTLTKVLKKILFWKYWGKLLLSECRKEFKGNLSRKSCCVNKIAFKIVL